MPTDPIAGVCWVRLYFLVLLYLLAMVWTALDFTMPHPMRSGVIIIILLHAVLTVFAVLGRTLGWEHGEPGSLDTIIRRG